MIECLKPGDKVELNNIVVGSHPTIENLQICHNMKEFEGKEVKVNRCSDIERIFQVKDCRFYFSYDHVKSDKILEALSKKRSKNKENKKIIKEKFDQLAPFFARDTCKAFNAMDFETLYNGCKETDKLDNLECFINGLILEGYVKNG